MLAVSWIISFAAIIAVGIYAGSKIKHSNEWTGGDKQLGSLSVASLFAAWQIGGMALIGAAQNGYNLGISGAWYSIAGSFYFIFIAFFAATIRKKMPGDSVPIFINERFGIEPSRLYSYAWIIYGFLYIPIQLKTSSTIIQVALPGVNPQIATLIGLVIGALFTGFAGMKGAEVSSKVVSIGTYVLLVGFVVVTLPKFGGYKAMMSTLPAEYSSMGNMPTQRIIAWVVGGCLSTAVMQSVLQPLLAAKSPKAARNGAFIGYFLAAPISIFTAMCGIFAKASGADLGDGATAFAWSIKEFTHPLVAGVIFAIGTMIVVDTMANMMLATGTIMTNVYRTQIKPNASDKSVLNFSRYGTMVMAALTLIPAFLIPSASLTNLFLSLQHVAAAPVSFSIFAGLFWKRCTKQGSFWSMLLGMIVGVSWMLLGLTDILEAVYPTVLVSYTAGIVVSLATSKKEELKA